MSPEIDIRSGSQIRSRDVLQFVVLAKPRGPSSAPAPSTSIPPATNWTIPEPREFHSLMNRAECFMIDNKLPCYNAHKWGNLWGKVGLVGLSAKVPRHIEDFRTVIEGLSTDTLTFTIFPRDAVENRGSISVLLRDTFKEFSPKCLPAAIFRRNKGLRGSLRATHTKTYGAEDKTRSGASKKGWRLILLQGCSEFMRSLEAYEEDEKFTLGSGYIYIRGGVRKPRSGPPRGALGRGQPRQQRNNRDNHPRTPLRDSFNEQFPTIPEERESEELRRPRGRGRGTEGSSAWSAPPPGRGRQPASLSWGGQ